MDPNQTISDIKHDQRRDNISESKLLNELDCPPQNIDQLVFLIRLLDDMCLFGCNYVGSEGNSKIRNMNDMSLMSAEYIDAAYLIARASNMFFSMAVEKSMDDVIYMYRKMFSFEEEAEDQLKQDTMYVMETMMKSNVALGSSMASEMVKNHFHNALETEYYQLNISPYNSFFSSTHRSFDVIGKILFSALTSFQKQTTFMSNTLDAMFNEPEQYRTNEMVRKLTSSSLASKILEHDVSVMDVYDDYVVNYSSIEKDHCTCDGHSNSVMEMITTSFSQSRSLKKRDTLTAIFEALNTWGDKGMYSDFPGLSTKKFYEAIHTSSYESLVEHFRETNEFPEDTKAIFVYRLLGAVFNTNIIVHDSDLNVVKLTQPKFSSETVIHMNGYVDDKICNVSDITITEKNGSDVIEDVRHIERSNNILFEM